MSSAVEAGYARTETLQREWNALKSEMDGLVTALSRKKDDKRAERKGEIERRMQKITAEMTSMLAAARKEVPGMSSRTESDDIIEEEDQSKIKLEKRAPGPMVMRTYDSTDDDESANDSTSFSSDDDDHDDATITTHQLRENMRLEAIARNPNVDVKVVTVEVPRPGGVPGKGTEAEAVGRRGMPLFGGFRGKIRKDTSETGGVTSPGNTSTTTTGSQSSAPSSPSTVLSDDEREELKLEASRLEREARKLKKKDGRTPRDDHDLDKMAHRLSDLARQLRAAEAAKDPFRDQDKRVLESNRNASPTDAPPVSSKSPTGLWHRNGNNNSNATKPACASKVAFVENSALDPNATNNDGMAKPKNEDREVRSHSMRYKSSRYNAPDNPVKPAGASGADDSAFDVEALPDEEAYQQKGVSLRKKTMQSLEIGVASIRALSHRFVHAEGGPGASADNAPMNDSAPPKSALFRKLAAKPSASSLPGPNSQNAQVPSPPAQSPGGDPYSEMAERLARRNEQLGTLNTQSDQMTDGASEMLSSARNLRKRQEKGLFR
jgi:hypothetical protein